MRVRYVDTRKEVVHGPEVVDGFPPMRHDDQSAFSSKVVYQELEERVDGESLVNISDRVKDRGAAR